MGELADLLRSQEKFDDAIRIYERMLDLNPNDNQGVRDPLLGLYLTIGDQPAAAKLIKKYEKDSMANFSWGLVLERFLAGDLTAASKALAKARAGNPHVELYLTGQKRIPEHLPEMYSAGSEEEAILCMDNLVSAWARHTDALLWLVYQCLGSESNASHAKPPGRNKNRLR